MKIHLKFTVETVLAFVALLAIVAVAPAPGCRVKRVIF